MADLESIAAQIIAQRVARRATKIDEAKLIANFYWQLVDALEQAQPAKAPRRKPPINLPPPGRRR